MTKDLIIDNQPRDLNRLKSQIFFGITLFLYGYFFVRILFFAFNISPLVPPDEIDHFGICRIFSESWPFLPQDSPASYQYGPITGIPYLYYYLMGSLLKLNFLDLNKLHYLRFINTLLAMLFLFYAHRWLCLVTPNRVVQSLFLVMLTNTPMLGFIGASINYDNLLNLMAVMSLYYLHAFLKSYQWRLLLLFGICILAGSMIKITFLPLGLIFLAILAYGIYRHRDELTSAVVLKHQWLNPIDGVLIVMIILLTVTNISLYGGNLWKFGTLMPETRNILGETNALRYRFAAEKIILSQYRDDIITFEQAVAKAHKHIDRQDDLNRTLFYLQIARDYKLAPRPIMDRITYADVWYKVMLRNSFGILGHKSMMKQPWELGIYHLFFLTSILFIVRYWRPSIEESALTDALIIVVIYTLIIMQYANYQEYTRHLSPDSGIQGRYLFPVLSPLYGTMAYYLLKPFRANCRIVLSLIIAAYFIYGDFPFFLSQATGAWFSR